MPRDLPTLLYVGIKNSVIALDIATGVELWRTKLKGQDFVTVLFDGTSLVAANAGELFALDPKTGAVLWQNSMKGMGLGIVSLASSRMPSGVSTSALSARQQMAIDAAAGGG